MEKFLTCKGFGYSGGWSQRSEEYSAVNKSRKDNEEIETRVETMQLSLNWTRWEEEKAQELRNL